MRTVPMFALPAVYTRRSALAAQLRRKYLGTRQFSSRDLAVQRDEHHPCWKTAHFLPCTRPPDVMRMQRPQRRAAFGPSQRRAFVVTRSGFQTMPSGGLGNDEDTVAGVSFGNVRQPAPLVKSADLQTALHDHEYWNQLGLDEVYHTYAAVLEVNGISPHQVLLERKIDDFSHKNAGDAIPAVAARFPHSDVSADSDLEASR